MDFAAKPRAVVMCGADSRERACAHYLDCVTPQVLGLHVESRDQPGVFYRVAETIFRHGANITYIAGGEQRAGAAGLQIEVTGAGDSATLVKDLQGLEAVTKVTVVPTFKWPGGPTTRAECAKSGDLPG